MSDAPQPEHPASPSPTPEEGARVGPPPHPYAASAAGTRHSKRRIWFIAGVVALAFTIAVIAFSTLRIEALEETASTPPGLTAPTPDNPNAEMDVLWPGNMQGGGVLYEKGMLPQQSEAPENNAVPTPRDVDRATGPADILMFVDYRCPACAVFEAHNGPLIEEAVDSGQATLEVQAVTFLDRIDEHDRYSTRAAAAQACVIDGQPELAWQTHKMLLDPRFQPPQNETTPTDREVADAFSAAGGELTDEVRSCIEEQRFVPFASAMNEWVFQHPIPGAVNESLAVEGTPTVLVNGVLFEGNPGDSAAFASFLAEQGISLE